VALCWRVLRLPRRPPQLGLDLPAAVNLVNGLEATGLIATSSPDGPGPVELTAEGTALHASLAQTIAATTRELYAGIDPRDLVTAHAVLRQVIDRADRMNRNSGLA
jgi:DNA-binding MarR family transcriptional regulator